MPKAVNSQESRRWQSSSAQKKVARRFAIVDRIYFAACPPLHLRPFIGVVITSRIYTSRPSIRHRKAANTGLTNHNRRNGLGRNCLAGYQPAVLFIQTQVRHLRAYDLLDLTDSSAQDNQGAKLLSQRTQCYWSLQPSIMPPRQLSLCHHSRRPANAASLPLHQDHRTCTHAQQMVGEDSSQQQLLQGS